MRIIAVVFGECNTILFALFMNDGEKVEWCKRQFSDRQYNVAALAIAPFEFATQP